MRKMWIAALLAAGVCHAVPVGAVEWKFFSPWPANFEIANWDKGFVEDVNKAAGGRLTITYFSGGELPYRGNDVLKAVATNRVQMVATVAGFVAGEAPELNVYSLPFLCTTYDGFLKSIPAVSPVMDKMLEDRFKVKTLYHWTFPPQQIYTVKPLPNLDALQGRKIRLWNPLHAEMITMFKGSPTTIDPTELTPALQRGVVDGTITSATTIVDTKLYDVVEGGLMLDFMLGHSFTLVNGEEWAKLPADLQAIVMDKAKAWTAEADRRSRTYDDGARKTLVEKKMNLRNPTPDEMKKAQDALRPTWDGWAQKNGPVAQTLVREVARTCTL